MKKVRFFLLDKGTFITAVSFLLILLFTYTGVNKLNALKSFQIQIGQSPLISKYVTIISWTIPGIEIMISIFLIIPALRLLGLYLSFGLLSLFTGYIIIITKYSPYVPCSCGGIIQELSWKEHLWFNIIFALLTVAAIFLSKPALDSAKII